MSKEVSNRIGFGEKRSTAKNLFSDAQKISRATSVIKNEPALKLIQKINRLDERILKDAREGLITLRCAFCRIVVIKIIGKPNI